MSILQKMPILQHKSVIFIKTKKVTHTRMLPFLDNTSTIIHAQFEKNRAVNTGEDRTLVSKKDVLRKAQ